ncbi:hypothetical protein D3C75_709450 [compost metagenome]
MLRIAQNPGDGEDIFLAHLVIILRINTCPDQSSPGIQNLLEPHILPQLVQREQVDSLSRIQPGIIHKQPHPHNIAVLLGQSSQAAEPLQLVQLRHHVIFPLQVIVQKGIHKNGIHRFHHMLQLVV